MPPKHSGGGSAGVVLLVAVETTYRLTCDIIYARPLDSLPFGAAFVNFASRR
jgi:hypothetical protein